MRHAMPSWSASWRELAFLTCVSAAGIIASVYVALHGPTAEDRTRFAPDQIVDRGLHNLSPDECRTALATLVEEARGRSDVLWLWVEESVPGRGVRRYGTAATSVSRAAPRAHAFRAAAPPAATCAHPSNSLHALSLGGVARPMTDAEPDPWAAEGGP
ncbi:MAG TPA: hypothetical protein VD860_18805 [Azospirillum sp.]|nr:hypothetical protein [Azospirillum sp.]